MDSFDYLEGGTIVAERYRIVSPLASGGFGAVYVAEQLATDRTVALKMLWPHLVHGGIERFLLEARIAGRLNSEHIVQVLDAGMDPERRAPFLVMELLAGSDLEQLVERDGPLDAVRAADYLRQTAIGLDRAHNFVERDGRPAPIVHRDLKPGNLFLSRREDGSDIIKILDFGIAKVLSASKSLSGAIRGTPLYMAYEQAAQAPITPAADIWSFGLIAFFLLTGKAYWKAAQDSEQVLTRLFAEVLTLPLDPPSVRARELGLTVALPLAFDDWFSRAVNRNPAERMRSAGEAARELALALDLEPIVSSGRRSVPVSRSRAPGPISDRTSAVPAEPRGRTLQSDVLATSELTALGRTQRPYTRGRKLWVIAAVPLLAAAAAVFFFLPRGISDGIQGISDKATAQPSETTAPVEEAERVPSPETSPAPTATDATERPTVAPLLTASVSPAPPGATPRARPRARATPRASASAPESRADAPYAPTEKPSSIYGVR